MASIEIVILYQDVHNVRLYLLRTETKCVIRAISLKTKVIRDFPSKWSQSEPSGASG